MRLTPESVPTAPVTPAPPRLQIIYNPVAGPRRERRFRQVLSRLRRAGCHITVRETTRSGDAEDFARRATAIDCDVLVAAGGDGTINEVINGMVERGLPLAIIPLGTANVLAAEIGVSTRPDDIARAIVHGRRVPVTVGRINDRRFIQMAGVGFDAHVVEAVSPSLKRLLGKGAYVIESLAEIINHRPTRFPVEIDGEAHDAATVILANGHFYAGRYICAPEASVRAPVIHVCLFRDTGRLACIKYSLALLLGLIPRLPSVEIRAARHIVLKGPSGEPVQCDGDILAALPAEVRVEPDRLELMMPPER